VSHGGNGSTYTDVAANTSHTTCLHMLLLLVLLELLLWYQQALMSE
jgi:hypothetical protein